MWWSPNKSWGAKAWASFPSGRYVLCHHTSVGAGGVNTLCDSAYQGRTTRNSKFETLRDPTPVPLPLIGFIPVNSNLEYSGLQWFPWVLLANYQVWGWFWKPPKFAVGATCEGTLRGRSLTSYYVPIILILPCFVYYANIRVNIFAFV